jgi:hypothetical protein
VGKISSWMREFQILVELIKENDEDISMFKM